MKLIALQKYNDDSGLGRVLVLGPFSIEFVYINVEGHHLSIGMKFFDIGFSITIHT